tara:strand:+ start:116 stop:307 length:192 start_codon:yes stop_codon:yes gene_type:complete
LVFDHCQTEDNVDFHFASDKNSVKVKFLGGMHLSLDGDVNQLSTSIGNDRRVSCQLQFDIKLG